MPGSRFVLAPRRRRDSGRPRAGRVVQPARGAAARERDARAARRSTDLQDRPGRLRDSSSSSSRRRSSRSSSATAGASGTAENAEGPQIHGNTRIEIIWTVVPAVALLHPRDLHVLKVPGRGGDPDRGRGRARRRGDRAPVLLAVRVSGRRALVRHALPPGRPPRHARDPLGRRRPRVVGARADRQAGRDPGPHERAQLHAARGRNVRQGRLRRVLRHPAHARCGRSSRCERRRLRGLARRERAGRPGRASASRSGRRRAPSATASPGEGDIGPPIAGNATLTDPGGAAASSSRTARTRARSRATCRRPGYGWTDAQIDALVAYVQSNPELAEAPVAVSANAAPVARPGLERRAASRLAHDRRPQADRDPLHRHRLRVLPPRRRDGAGHAAAAHRRRTSTSSPRTPTTRSSRCTGRR